jgi:hypothetical protein
MLERKFTRALKLTQDQPKEAAEEGGFSLAPHLRA